MNRVNAIWSSVAPKLGPLLRGSRRYYSEFSPKRSNLKSKYTSRFLQGAAFGIAGGFTLGIYSFLCGSENNSPHADSLSALGFDVNLQPLQDMDSFPSTISINNVAFQCLGTGVRSVTFISFNVYVAGIYIADEDIPLARRVLQRFCIDSTTSDLGSQLQDLERSEEIIDTLLKEKVRLAVRIVPTRTTDFSHLRDGFVRSVTNHKQFKSLQSPEVGESIGEIKKAFGRKRKLKRGEVIVWARDKNGGMSAWYGDKLGEFLGSYSSADVSRLFYLQYLTGSKPNSPSLKENTLAALAKLGQNSR